MITRDYKPGPEKKPTPAPGWAWLLVGLLIGLFVGFLIYLDKAVPVSEKKAVSNQTEAKPQVLPHKEKHNAVEENEKENKEFSFSFYNELPRRAIDVPAHELEQKTIQQPKTNRPHPVNKAKIDTPQSSVPKKPQLAQSTYILQVGSFRNPDEAESLKARLAFMGLQATIQPVTVNKNQRWMRVRVGPFPSFKQAEQVQTRLKRKNITAMLLKLSG
ncbi:MAG: SPOR domain-containing protein [Gammaproteobacteria bacterium]|nr:SPOR domain-containing protein [Gammaproteobacteria bacterium]